MNKLFRNRWWVVVASCLGLIVGSGTINMLASAVFMIPVSKGLGISRGDFSFAVSLNAWLSALSFPVLGWLLDRWGTRRIMIPGILLCGLTTAAYFYLPYSPGMWIYLLFAFAGFVYGCQSPMPYDRVISQWFDRDRGLALGIEGVGMGVGTVLIPPFAAVLIVRYGWRMAYLVLAACVLILGLVPVGIFLREGPGFSKRGARGVDSSEQPAPIGAETGQAFKSREFWALTVAFFLGAMALSGTSIHVVAMLTDRGISLVVATAAYSAAGLSSALGRLACGKSLDRFSGPRVAVVFSSFGIMGLAVLLFAHTELEAVVACLLLGTALGSLFGLLPFFVSRYFGLKNYGKIYGVIFAGFAFGVGAGIALSGTAYDIFHGYRVILLVYEVLLVVSCILYLLLGSYPYPAPKRMAPVAPTPTESGAQ